MKKMVFGAFGLGLLLVLAGLVFPGMAAADDDEEVFEARFVPCVTALCGSDSTATIHEAEVEVYSNGNVKLEMESSSLVNASLNLSYQPFNGVQTVIGTFTTDANGDVDDDLVVGVLSTTNTMGIFIISDAAGAGQYVTAFSTSPTTPVVEPNSFDDASTSTELKASYKQKVAETSKRSKAQSTSLKGSLSETKAKLKADYIEKAATLQ